MARSRMQVEPDVSVASILSNDLAWSVFFTATVIPDLCNIASAASAGCVYEFVAIWCRAWYRNDISIVVFQPYLR